MRINRRAIPGRKVGHQRHNLPTPPTIPFEATDFPKPWLYYGTTGFGFDVQGTDNLSYQPGSWNMTRVNQIARFPLVTINSHPFASYGPSDAPSRQLSTLLKAARPTINLIQYDTLHLAIPFLTVGSQWKELSDLSIGPPDVRFLYESDGTLYPDPSAWLFDMGQVKVAALAIWLAHGGLDPNLDGFFLDYANGIYALGSTLVDIGALGYSTLAQFNASGKAGLDYIVDGLKATGRDVWGNGTADADSIARWRGRLFEGWSTGLAINGSAPPLFPSGGFDTAMSGPDGILNWQGSTPTGDGYCLLKSETDASSVVWNTAAWRKKARYTLGSATIAGGYGYVGDNRNQNGLSVDDAEMWADEYAVIGGVSQTTGANGWLGRPTEFGYKDSGGCYVRHFDNGLVIVNGDGTTSHSFNPGSGYRKIQGIYDTSVNDGSTVSGAVTVPGKDARFLLRG